jgi:nephrocystin-3
MRDEQNVESSKQENQRVMRVFISSTFRDMMRERDLLVKEVFPALRRICAKRFVTFTEVDLRWGITEEQAAEGKVLPLCLAEIERSRPYFLGLLGERYGWIPDTIPAEVIEKEPWLKEHLHDRKSVTELEILHGVLNNPDMRGHASFYFRDPAYVGNSSLTEEERPEMVERDIPAEVEKFGPEEAARRTEERKGKLAALKQQIRDSKLPLVEPYENPEALAKIIEKQFGDLIDQLYPETEIPDALDRECMAHEAHAKNKLFACIDRPSHLAALTAFAEAPEHDGKGLVVTGESGSGKTALLAAWARDWAKSHPDDVLFQHYLGATPDGSSPDGFLRRLLGELKNRFGITEEIPSQPDKLREALPLWLAQTINKGRIILILDGLNQVQGSEPDFRLNFLPRHFPPNVVVLASSLPSPALDTLLERGWVEHDLPRASEAEVDAMVGEYLKIHARTLEPVLRHELVTATGAKNPLFLRTVLEELRQFGSFERLPQRVRHYLEADNPKDLFLRVLTRWQEDFDGQDSEQDKPKIDLVRRALTHLWAARQGLSESEWLDLLGDGAQPLPRALWTPLFLALEPHLSQRAGPFAFGHDYLRQAVEEAFVFSDDLQKVAHLSVADYFEHHAHQIGMNPRKAAEWPFQLNAAEEWERLLDCLVSVSLFLSLFNDENKWELAAYWRALQQVDVDMGTCCFETFRQRRILPKWPQRAQLTASLGQFLMENGQFKPALTLLNYLVVTQVLTLGLSRPLTLTCIEHIASIKEQTEELSIAEKLYRFVLKRRERSLGPGHSDTLRCGGDLSLVLCQRGQYEQAEILSRRTLAVQEQRLGHDHPATLKSVSDLSLILYLRACASRSGDPEAEELCRRALEGRERVLGPEHPDTITSINNLGSMLHAYNRPGAESLLRRALALAERVYGPEHPSTLLTVETVANLLENRGNLTEAESLLRRHFNATLRIYGPEYVWTKNSADNLARVLDRNQRQQEARELRIKAGIEGC